MIIIQQAKCFAARSSRRVFDSLAGNGLGFFPKIDKENLRQEFSVILNSICISQCSVNKTGLKFMVNI
jgi:hypothetical protein